MVNFFEKNTSFDDHLYDTAPSTEENTEFKLNDRCKLGIHHLFEYAVAATPEVNAIICGNESINYNELNIRANQLAHELIMKGTRPDDLIVVCTRPSIAMIVAILAILKAGGAYVPLDPGYPYERLAHILNNTNSKVILADVDGKESLGKLISGKMALDPNTSTNQINSNPQIENFSHRNLAYVIYTSGSTGLPKGVMIEHRNLIFSTQARLEKYCHKTGDAILLLSSVSFDSSVASIFSTLVTGGTIHIPKERIVRNPAGIARYIKKNDITDFLCIPALAELILKSLIPKKDSSIKRIIVAGESCSKKIADIARQFPEIEFYNEYGPTEATVWATVARISSERIDFPVPIGTPIAGVKIYLLDEAGQHVQSDTIGEIYIGGNGVGRGYLKQPELTAERFLPDPFSESIAARMYRTGDLARYSSDGHLMFVGRNDAQVKIRGYRVELSEIETWLCKHPTVHDAVAVAVAVESGGEDKFIAAYVTGDRIDVRDLLKHLDDNIPTYMLPRFIEQIDTLPRSANGKIDKRALKNKISTSTLTETVISNEAPRPKRRGI